MTPKYTKTAYAWGQNKTKQRLLFKVVNILYLLSPNHITLQETERSNPLI